MRFRTATVIDYIKDNCSSFSGRVYGTADEAVAKKQKVIATPVAWVFPINGRGQPNKIASGGHSQLITTYFGVMTAVRNVADPTGQTGTAVLEPLRDDLHQLLLGWTPDDMANPCDYVIDRAVGYDEFVLKWVDVFSTQYYARKP